MNENFEQVDDVGTVTPDSRLRSTPLRGKRKKDNDLKHAPKSGSTGVRRRLIML